MIEQSLLDRFPGNLAAIQDFFQAGWRQTAVRTTSSITFADHPATLAINPRLLAEEDRLALAAAEEASRRGFAADAAMGRLTASLRMGVTPKMVVQEEEEEKLNPPVKDDPFAGSPRPFVISCDSRDRGWPRAARAGRRQPAFGAGGGGPIAYPDAATWARLTEGARGRWA